MLSRKSRNQNIGICYKHTVYRCSRTMKGANFKVLVLVEEYAAVRRVTNATAPPVCSAQRRQSEEALHRRHEHQKPALPAGLRRPAQSSVHTAGLPGRTAGETPPPQSIMGTSWTLPAMLLLPPVLTDVYFLFQLKLIYSKNSVLAKSFRGSTIQAFR